MKRPRWGSNLSPLLIINLLHFRLRLFSQPKERFSLRKKFNKSHKCSRAAKALAEAQPCTSLWGRRTQTDARLEAPSYEDFIPLRGMLMGGQLLPLVKVINYIQLFNARRHIIYPAKALSDLWQERRFSSTTIKIKGEINTRNYHISEMKRKGGNAGGTSEEIWSWHFFIYV